MSNKNFGFFWGVGFGSVWKLMDRRNGDAVGS